MRHLISSPFGFVLGQKNIVHSKKEEKKKKQGSEEDWLAGWERVREGEGERERARRFFRLLLPRQDMSEDDSVRVSVGRVSESWCWA